MTPGLALDDATVFADRATYESIVREHGAAIARLVRGYERDAGRAEDLAQEALVAIWRALPTFAGRSSLKTWVLAIAHNVAVSHVVRARRDVISRWTSLEDVDVAAAGCASPEGRIDLQKTLELVRALKPLDRQTMLLWLEGLTTEEIAEATGLSTTNVGVKVFRVKALLAQKMEREQ